MACESSTGLPALPLALTLAHSRIRLILLSAVLLSAVHPGVYAVTLQDSKAYVYELNDRSDTYGIEHGARQRVHSH